MTKLSVNINKVALIRNSRDSNLPDLRKVAQDCEAFGAQGITVHPRPDQRHVRFADIPELLAVNHTEFNIEGYPSEDFIQLVLKNQPTQVTLVPDSPDALTSTEGWDTIKHENYLKEIVNRFHDKKIRVSLFLDANEKMVEAAKLTGADRIEFYTGKFSHDFYHDKQKAIQAHIIAGNAALNCGLGINAGHDLNLDNLKFYAQNIEGLLEVSIGHALICDALYYGLHNTIQMYLRQLKIEN
ncbi:MAG: pyridoxine 5'-phosphate synthase [Saprospiraceae bacterium]